MPGVQPAAAVPGQDLPMLVDDPAQSAPLQQRFGFGAVWAVQARPVAQAPVESQRQPFEPAIQVVATDGGGAVTLPPHTLGTPGAPVLPQPQHPVAQAPQSTIPPQPFDMGPHLPVLEQSVIGVQGSHSPGVMLPHRAAEQLL